MCGNEFIFSELLEANRKNLVEGQSFLLTVIKDKKNMDNRFKRLNVREVVHFKTLTQRSYKEVLIQIDKSDNLKKLSDSINEFGDSKIKISVIRNEKNYIFELKEKRKFDYQILRTLNKEQYIKKIIF